MIRGRKETAIQALSYAANNFPTNFDANFLLGKLYFEQKKYLESVAYLKQAYCLDNKSYDVLKILPYAMLNLGDFTSAYCCFKRLLPLLINNQKEYLEIVQTIKQLETGLDSESISEHKVWGDRYYSENNYHYALFEYENCVLIDGAKTDDIAAITRKIKNFLKPEERIIKTCFEKGDIYYSNGDFRQSNKYFSKISEASPFYPFVALRNAEKTDDIETMEKALKQFILEKIEDFLLELGKKDVPLFSMIDWDKKGNIIFIPD